MFVIGSHIGFVMVFDDLEDLSTVIGHLRGMWEHAKENDTPPPHLYGVFSQGVSQAGLEAFMASLKDGGDTADLIIIQDDSMEDDNV
jgi:hypothetical protein